MSTPWGLMIPGRPPLGLKYMLQEQSILVEQGGHTGVVVVRGGRVGGWTHTNTEPICCNHNVIILQRNTILLVHEAEFAGSLQHTEHVTDSLAVIHVLLVSTPKYMQLVMTPRPAQQLVDTSFKRCVCCCTF